jgi:adenylate cyclase
MARDAVLEKRLLGYAVRLIEFELAKEKARTGGVGVDIEMLRALVDEEFRTGAMTFRGPAVAAFVESLLQRGGDADVREAEAVIERLAAVSTEPGFVLYEISLLRLRSWVARARGDEVTYRTFRNRYRAMATSLGFEGHIASAEAMT